MKKILFIILIIIIVVVLGFFVILNIKPRAKTGSEKISIITTLFPSYDLAKTIGGDKVDVFLLLPPGVEAHAYEPKPSDVAKINNADIFVYTGEFMEPWVQDIIKSLTQKVKVVNVSFGVNLISAEEREEDHSGVDPHIWLDFANAKIMAENITKALVEVDPANTDYYQHNLQSYQDKLTELDNKYKNTLSFCQTKTIVYGGHYAFGYLAKRYGLNYIAAQGFAPDSEPSAKDLINLVEQIKKNNIEYLFYEELTSPKIAQTLAQETNVKLLLLNGAHNLSSDDYNSGVTFISLMEKNLTNLAIGLKCHKSKIEATDIIL